MNDRLDHLIAQSIAEGILPAGAQRPSSGDKPWPVIVLTALGAWLAAIPLVIVLALGTEGFLIKGVTPFFVGPAMLAAVVAMLRSPRLPPFLEQCALPVLLAGGTVLGFGIAENSDGRQLLFAILAATAVVTAWLIPRRWLRTLLGAAACALAVATLSTEGLEGTGWWPLHISLAIWLAARAASRYSLDCLNERTLVAIDAIADGWIVITMAGLAYWSGATFLFAAHVDVLDHRNSASWLERAAPAGSLLLGLAGAAVIARRWPSLRQFWSMLVALILVGLCWLMPSLGAALLLAAVFATALRWRMAISAGLSAAWTIGAFYYQLSMPLADKSIVMVGAGALLAMAAWTALRWKPSAGVTDRVHVGKTTSLGIVICALAVLTVANVGIWQKENLIAQGKPIFVELAPADPRSLMQGDYMALNFALASREELMQTDRRRRVPIVTSVDQRGVARFARLATENEVLAADELKIELTPKGGRHVLATDAWYFKEGDADRWARATFGEFRVDANGRVLLVGMRGPKLEPL